MKLNYGLSVRVTVTGLIRLAWFVGAMTLATHAVAATTTSIHDVSVWLTTGDQMKLMQRESGLFFVTAEASNEAKQIVIQIDPSRRYQEMVGFGASISDASAWLINTRMTPEQRQELLVDLFDAKSGIGLNFVRLTIGASDFSRHHYTFDDRPSGEIDAESKSFSIAPNRVDVLPVTKAALQVNSEIKVMASPWSAPAWMKTNGHLYQGKLKPEMHDAFADYLLRYVTEYEKEGIPMFALTVQNEPHFEPPDYPGMRISPTERAALIGRYLGPKLSRLKQRVRIIEWDHNWDEPHAPLAVLADPQANRYVDGVGWHCYAGTVDAQSKVHEAHPDKETYFTECSGGAWKPHFAETFPWFMRHLIIGTTRHWAKGVLLWNLALDENHGPHLGGCKDCRGVVTIDSRTGSVTRNLEYYALAHASRFVHRGAHRIHTEVNGSDDIDAVAFRNSDGSMALLASNSALVARNFNVRLGGKSLSYKLPPSSAITLVWREESASGR
jgi:glucosylceramidase